MGGISLSLKAEEDAACVRSILAGRPERFSELVKSLPRSGLCHPFALRA